MSLISSTLTVTFNPFDSCFGAGVIGVVGDMERVGVRCVRNEVGWDGSSQCGSCSRIRLVRRRGQGVE